MRLLNTGSLQLEEFLGHIPKYAILSHTWREDEVLYEDVKKGEPEKKKGYAKISKCCTMAVSDGYQYVWIDTCCIDKSSSAELSEAINSMFDWYEDSSICYVYLDDVSTPDDGTLSTDLLSRSRWISRGWTLQELIAPELVNFYSSSWDFCGTRQSLREALHQITLIDREYLGRGSNSASRFFNENVRASFSIAQRMSWASKRETTRPEDMAYCLMGIFEVNMSLLYGEGGPEAFRRLQEEIIKISQDQSIFAWSTESIPHGYQTKGVLARRPLDFQSGHNIVRFHDNDDEPYDVTNKGLRIRLLLTTTEKMSDGSELEKYLHTPAFIAVLNCHYNYDFSGQICIPLEAEYGNTYIRIGSSATAIKTADIEKAESESIYISRHSESVRWKSESKSSYIWIRATFSSEIIRKEHIKIECDGGIWHESTGVWQVRRQRDEGTMHLAWLLFVSYNVPGTQEVIFTVGAFSTETFGMPSVGIFPGRRHQLPSWEWGLGLRELEKEFHHHKVRANVADEATIMGERVKIVDVSFHEEGTEMTKRSKWRDMIRRK